MVRIRSASNLAATIPMSHGIARIVFALVLLIAACGGDGRAEPLTSACTKTYPPQTLDMTQPINLGQLKAQLYFYACSGAYDRDLNKVLADAQALRSARAR
jgi:hypothetical protein